MLSKEVIQSIWEADYSPISTDAIRKAFEDKFEEFDIGNIEVGEISIDNDGSIYITFTDVDTDEDLVIIFNYDKDEGASAIIADDEESDDSYTTVVELDPMVPPILDTPYGSYLNLADLSWMNVSAMRSIFTGGDYDFDSVVTGKTSLDAYGNVLGLEPGVIESITLTFQALEEAMYKVVVRGGKKVKLPLVRRKRKKRLTASQRAGLRRAKITRKSAASKRKRALSIKARKRLRLKGTGAPKGYRIGG